MVSILLDRLRSVRCGGLFLLCALCCALAAVPSRSSAQLAHQTGMFWGVDPMNGKPYFYYKSNETDSPSGAGWSITMSIKQTWDNYRQIQGGPLRWAGNTLAGSSLVGAGKPLTALVPGQKVYGSFTADAAMYKLVNQAVGSYPDAQVLSGLPAGRYICTVSVSHGDGSTEKADLLLFSAGGQFFTEQQGPLSPDPQTPVNADPQGDPTSTLCSVSVHVDALTGLGTPTPQGGYVCELVTTSKTYTTNTDSDGNAIFARIPVQFYTMHVTGHHTGTPSGTVYDSSSGGISVKRGATTNVSVVFGNNGTGVLAGVDPNTANGAANTGGHDSSTDNANTSGFWQTLFQSLFVPQSSTVDAVKADAVQFANWGPGALLVELTAAFDSPVSSMPGLVIPNFFYDLTVNPGHDAEGHTTMNRGAWRLNSGDPGTTIDPTAGAGSVPMMGTLRAWMGGAVWVMFAIGVGQRMMPKQVM